MNYVNYLKHIIHTPGAYHRRFDLDVPAQEPEPVWKTNLKRVAFAALPFISMYKPAGNILSLGMGSCRVVSHICSWELVSASLAALPVASTIFNFSLGLAMSTAVDVVQGGVNVGRHLLQREYRKATEEALQTLASATYLGYMASGSLELMVAFSLLQATVCFAVQARGDWEKGHYLEAAAKVGMGVLRCYQVKGLMHQIQRRNQFMHLKKYAALMERAWRGREVRHLISHPMSELREKIEDGRSEELDLGTHLHGYGKALVKGANLTFRTEMVGDKEVVELEFKVNHVFRTQIQQVINDVSKLKAREIEELLRLSDSHATGIHVHHTELPLGDDTAGLATQITLNGLGSILIGGESNFPNMFDRVIVRMDADKNLYDFHELMSFLDVDQALHTSSQQDLERLKMGHLFRIFCPREATPFERSEEFFTLPIDELRKKMIEKAPDMEHIFEDYYARMTPEAILPGKMRYRVNGLAQEAYAHGARGLTAAITGAYEDKDLFERIASMLRIGMLSSETRTQAKMTTHGLSGGSFDLYTGGADSVFTQMITEKDCSEKCTFGQVLAYHGRARMLISLDAIETGTYQYPRDEYGYRRLDPWLWWWGDAYSNRPSILELTDTMQERGPISYWSEYSGHEIMLKERVAPTFFTGIALEDEATRDNLLSYLRSQDLVQLNERGIETIRGKPVDQFLRVTTTASEDLFT